MSNWPARSWLSKMWVKIVSANIMSTTPAITAATIKTYFISAPMPSNLIYRITKPRTIYGRFSPCSASMASTVVNIPLVARPTKDPTIVSRLSIDFLEPVDESGHRGVIECRLDSANVDQCDVVVHRCSPDDATRGSGSLQEPQRGSS